jgi:tetratricopeptide (TPR) repeat protein
MPTICLEYAICLVRPRTFPAPGCAPGVMRSRDPATAVYVSPPFVRGMIEPGVLRGPLEAFMFRPARRKNQGTLGTSGSAVHRAIVCVDVQGYGDRSRTNPDQIAVRDGLYSALEYAFSNSGVPWEDCYHEDRGDGVLILVPPEVTKDLLVTGVLEDLSAALLEHNRQHGPRVRIRLRMAVHAGEVHHDKHGVAATAINVAFRLLEAESLKRELATTSGVLAVIASQWFYDEVIRHTPTSRPEAYRRVHISVKETETTAWICLPGHPDPPQIRPYKAQLPPWMPEPRRIQSDVPRQLPAATASFVGRTTELDALTELLKVSSRGRTVVISAIGGTAGIGKSALAVCWAHQVADHFPDGQLYANLRGFDPTGPPVMPADVIRSFLDALNVRPERIPVSFDAQAGLYRSLLADRRLLVLLDNARDADQVRPLLPGSPRCMVVVTSRDRLTSLIIAEGAHPLSVDLLTVDEAQQLLARRIGEARVAAEAGVVREIITSCARLPLALSIVAARAAAHPNFPLATLAAELQRARGGREDRLAAWNGGEVAADMRAVFSWSYQRVSPAAALLFRQLGLHPGPDITLPAAASLTGLTTRDARSMLDELARAQLLQEHIPGRYAFHDLLRAYAADEAQNRDSQGERDAAVQRVLDHYLRTAHTAALLMYPRVGPIPIASPIEGVTPEQPTDYAQAWEWFEAEYPVLLAAIQLAVSSGQSAYAWQLSWALVEFFRRRGHWHECVTTHQAALTVALQTDDRQGQAHIYRTLGRACRWLARYDEAHAYLMQSLHLFEALADQVGQAHTHLALDGVLGQQGRPAEALLHVQEALRLSRANGDRLGEARALNGIGWCHALLGDYRLAITYCNEARTLYRELSDRRGESHALDSRGYADHALGRHQQAIASFDEALALRRELGDRWGQATTLAHLGDAHHSIGDLVAAGDAWRYSVEILDQLGHPDADQIRAKLRNLDGPAPNRRAPG